MGKKINLSPRPPSSPSFFCNHAYVTNHAFSVYLFMCDLVLIAFWVFGDKGNENNETD